MAWRRGNKSSGNDNEPSFSAAASGLTLTPSSSVQSLTVGGTTRIDWRVRNTGADSATNTTFSSTLPPGVNYLTSVVTDASFNPKGINCTYTGATRVLSCPIGTVAPSTTTIVQVSIRAGLHGTIPIGGTAISSSDVQPGGVNVTFNLQVSPLTCAPRTGGAGPKVFIQVQRLDANSAEVTIIADTTGAPSTNRLAKLQFVATNNAVIDFPNGPNGASGTFDQVLGDGPSSTSFVIRRSGTGAATVKYVVIDYCADPWNTFAGIGTGSVSSLLDGAELQAGGLADVRRHEEIVIG